MPSSYSSLIAFQTSVTIITPTGTFTVSVRRALRAARLVTVVQAVERRLPVDGLVGRLKLRYAEVAISQSRFNRVHEQYAQQHNGNYGHQ
jgi:hypothetical protein